MKARFLLVAAVSLVLAPAAWAGNPSEAKAWFDFENCSLCKPVMAEAGLMEHMKWETHVIATGMMGVCTVDPAFAVAYKRANENMTKAVKELESGKTMELCGFCTSYGALMASGAKSENFSTGGGDVMLLTATDAAVIAKIQAHAKRTIEESAKMEAAMGKDAKAAGK